MSKRTKPRSVLKVVQIFNPTVIRTDAASFRELVQELTGMNYQPVRRSAIKLKSTSSKHMHSHGNNVCNGMTPSDEMTFSGDPALVPYSLNWSARSCDDETSSSSSGSSRGNLDDLEMDIISALLDSSEPLPDCTMLPPLVY